MKNVSKFRPARRIPAARLERLRAANIVARQAREDKRQQQVQPTPEWEAAPRLTALPGGLYWSNKVPVPGIGQLVTMTRDGQPQQGTVAGYCHAAGFLGLVVEPTTPAKAAGRRKSASPRANCVFGSQLHLMQAA